MKPLSLLAAVLSLTASLFAQPIPLERPASFSIPSSNSSLRVAGFDYNGTIFEALLVSGRGQPAYAEVVTTDASGVLQTRTVLTPPATRAAGLSVSADGSMIVAGQDGIVRIYSPSGALSKSTMPNKVIDAQVINSNPTGLTYDGLEVLGQTGAAQSFIAPYKLLWPLALAPGTTSGEAAVIELGPPALNLLTLSTGLWRRVPLIAPGLEETRTEDGVVPAISAATVGKDNGRIFAAVNYMDKGLMTVIEFDKTGASKSRYLCPLLTSPGSPGGYVAPKGIGTAGNTLLTYSTDGQVAIYRLPVE